MAFVTDADLFYEAMDPCQFMFWDKEDRPYHYMANYDDSEDSEDGIPGAVLAAILKSQREGKEAHKPQRAVQPCKFFLRGNCRYGNQCRFKHHFSTKIEKQTDLCVFFQRGCCRYGESCHFRHEVGSEVAQVSNSPKGGDINANGRCSDFSPSDDEVSAGRLTRVRVCFDLPVMSSVPWEKANGNSAFFIEVFVDKRDDVVEYLYKIVEEKVKHPLFGSGMFELCKAGTSLDLSDKSKKLCETSVFLFGSCVDAVLIQSYNLASKLLNNETLQDTQRYPMSKLPRNAAGSFLEQNLRAQLKFFPKPGSDELTLVPSTVTKDSVTRGDNEPAKLILMQENIGRVIREHDEDSCQWCFDKGCQCLSSTTSDNIDSDDSELSYKSKASDTKKSSRDFVKGKERFECGTYPDILNACCIPSDIELKYGDIVSFGEYPKATFYAMGDSSKLSKLQTDHFIEVPYEISSKIESPIEKYSSIVQEQSSNIGERFAVCISNDDPLLLSTFGGRLPTPWKCSVVLKHGPSKAEIEFFRIEVGEDKYFDAVDNSSELISDGYYVTNIEDIYQRGQSLKETTEHAEFCIELSLRPNEMLKISERDGLTSPRIPTWFSTMQTNNGVLSKVECWKGPAEDLEIVKALIEDFYEGCTWRYAKRK